LKKKKKILEEQVIHHQLPFVLCEFEL